jgi:DNA-binding response OmpR family regulator
MAKLKQDHPLQLGLILVVEDDRNIAALLETYLQRAGFQVVIAGDGAAGLELARRHTPALVIVDLLLPEYDGWEVCRRLRRASDVPILILTAQKDEIDRVAGFTLGADDYVVKPFSPRELVERVKAILRRTSGGGISTLEGDAVLRRGSLELDPIRHSVTRDGRSIELTRLEFALLRTLMSEPGRVFRRQELLDRIYTEDIAVVDRVIDVHIGKLRQKLESEPSRPELIRTVRGVGYRFAEPKTA